MDVNVIDNDGNSALIFAVAYGQIDVTKKLIEKGAELDIKDSQGNTPLEIAKLNNNEDIIQLLTINVKEES